MSSTQREWEETSLPIAAQTPVHLKVKSLLIWSLSEALFLLGKTLSYSPSMGSGSPPHPVPLSRAAVPCPLTSPRAWTPGWGESREAQPHCKQEQEQVVSSSHPTPSEAESCFPMSPAHELLHLPFRSPQCSPHLGNKLAET